MMSNFAGLPESNKQSSKVFRPPGGSSTDIFGSDIPSTPRSVKNHMQSNIFSCEKGSAKNSGDQPRRGQKNADSYTRLFGDVDRPFTPAKNHMKSNLGFNSNNSTENGYGNGNTAGNGNRHNSYGKFQNGGSSSSASSVTSSTENLKINGLSKTVLYSKMGDKIDETLNVSPSPRNLNKNSETKDEHETTINTEDCPSARSSSSNKVTHKTEISESSPQQTVPLNNSEDSRSELTTSNSFSQKLTSAHSGLNRSNSRNPITGLGLEADGLKSRRNNCRRDGNPVTGEGYKSAGAEINTTIPSLNGANQVINKNRIPPGGFSSGLW